MRKRKRFTIPYELLDRAQYSRLNPLHKGLLLGMYAECDDYGILPVLKAGRRSEMDLVGHEAVDDALCRMRDLGLVDIYAVEGEGEFVQLVNYDQHLTSVQLARRSKLWPHKVNSKLTQSQLSVDSKLTNSQPNVDIAEKSSDSSRLPKRKVKRVLRSVNSSDSKKTNNTNTVKTSNNKTLRKSSVGYNSKSRAKLSGDFEKFWVEYRTTAKSFGKGPGSRKEAFTWWKRNKPPLAEVMEGLAKWAQSQDWADGFVRHAVNWLKGELWRDEPSPAKGLKPHLQPTEDKPVITEDEVPF